MRNWNIAALESFEFESGFQTTYEELKLGIILGKFQSFSFQTTYEELKLGIILGKFQSFSFQTTYEELKRNARATA